MSSEPNNDHSPPIIRSTGSFCCVIISVLFEALFVETRVEGVEIPAVELVGHQAEVLAEALIVHDLARSQESYRVDDVWVVAESQDVVVGRPRFLLPKDFVNMTCR